MDLIQKLRLIRILFILCYLLIEVLDKSYKRIELFANHSSLVCLPWFDLLSSFHMLTNWVWTSLPTLRLVEHCGGLGVPKFYCSFWSPEFFSQKSAFMVEKSVSKSDDLLGISFWVSIYVAFAKTVLNLLNSLIHFFFKYTIPVFKNRLRTRKTQEPIISSSYVWSLVY